MLIFDNTPYISDLPKKPTPLPVPPQNRLGVKNSRDFVWNGSGNGPTHTLVTRGLAGLHFKHAVETAATCIAGVIRSRNIGVPLLVST